MILKQAFDNTKQINLEDIDYFLENKFKNTLNYNGWGFKGYEVEKRDQSRVLLKDLILKFNKVIDSEFLGCYESNFREMGFKIDLNEGNDYSKNGFNLRVDYMGDKAIFTLEADANFDFERYFKNI